jgi:hypothetical protein
MTSFYQQGSFGHQPILLDQPKPTAFGFGHASRSTSPALPLQFGFGSSSRAASPVKGATPPPNSRRRRRESTPLEDDGRERSAEAMDVVGALTSKRPRREIKGIRGPSSVPPRVSASPDGQVEVDLGKQLGESRSLYAPLRADCRAASLPKDALLAILTSLIGQHPNLKPVVTALIPPPSLDAFHAALALLEKRVIDSVPRGSGVRDEYVWNRVRGPLDDYVTEARTFLNAFVPPAAASVPTEDVAHPTTIFTFLAALTASYRRIEVHLPRGPSADAGPHYRVAPNDPLASHLLPALFNAWHTFATRLAHSLNAQGRILSAETVRSWFRTLDALCEPTLGHGESAARRACEGVRERLVREVGWTVGVRPVATRRDDAMDDDEEL